MNKKVLFILALLTASITGVQAGTVCKCTSGSMTVSIEGDGTMKMSCSGGGKVSCKTT